ncbi:MAG: GTPase (G3E family) [Eggerthellaceae bacterium]|nr:GTPase (G3E family) [Eggerthellaceae bacterium]
MEQIRFMVMSGFLGAGKTTTMIALAEHMDENYGKTAIIANDLGANLVDTSLTQTSGCTVVEIGNDCICYQMDNTIDQIRRLRDKEDAVFVMSDIPGCGVGALDHVYHTLDKEHADEFKLSPFTVLVDPERLRMIMPEKADINLPDELVYLLKLQLEEADLIVLNKIDLLDDETIDRYMGFLKEACPDIPCMAISAREKTGIPELAEYLTTHTTELKNFSVRNNHEFEQAESKLTWYNRRVYFKTNSGEKVDCNAVVDDIIESIRMSLIERKRNVPHLKTFATSGAGDFNKASLIGVDYDIEYAQRFLRPHKNMRMIINARAVCESRPLARLMDDAIDEVCDRYDLDCQVFFTECFGMADEGR